MKPLYESLHEPVPFEDGALCVIPLGGLDEVGRNVDVLEYEGKLLIADYGVLFPEVYQPGVDLTLPNFPRIANQLDGVVGMVTTHGREDHTGAVPYLMKLCDDIPIYDSDLTLAFVEPKLHGHCLPVGDMYIIKSGGRLQLGPLELEFVQVTRSIPDALAICVRTSVGTALITGDFKIDHRPLDGRKTDLAAPGRIGSGGVDSFMIDSTNSEVPGFIPSKSEVDPVLDRIVKEAEGQVVVATFASHVHCVQQATNVAAKAGRHVVLIGRLMERNMYIVAEKGYLVVPVGLIVNTNELAALPSEKRLYMATGSQGEPRAVLARMSAGSHKFVNFETGDTVVVAASLIPGNETDVNRVVNEPIQLGAKIFRRGNAKVHVSGHACQGELLIFYNLIQPKNVMSIHGEPRHLAKNGQLAVSIDVPTSRVVFADGGVTVDLKDEQARISGQVPCEPVFVDDKSVGEISEGELEIHRVLNSKGLTSAYAVVEHDSGMVLSGPTVKAIDMAEGDAVFDEVLPDVEDALRDVAVLGGKDPYILQQAMRRVLGRWVTRRLRRRPTIAPVVVGQ